MITKEIGDKKGEVSAYANLGVVFQSVDQCTKAEEYLEKAPVIRKEMGDQKIEASHHGSLGTDLILLVNIPRLNNIFKKH